MGYCDSKPSAIMRGPPMPANAKSARRALSALIKWAPSRSPDASPATMPMRQFTFVHARRCVAGALAQNSPLARSEEIDDQAHLWKLRCLGDELLARFLERELTAIERAIRTFERGNRLD